MAREAEVLVDLIHSGQAGTPPIRPDDEYESTDPALVRMFDRGLIDITRIRDDGYLFLGFSGLREEIEAYRLMSADHIRRDPVHWVSRRLADDDGALTPGIALICLRWHYRDASTTKVSVTTHDNQTATLSAHHRDGSISTRTVPTSDTFTAYYDAVDALVKEVPTDRYWDDRMPAVESLSDRALSALVDALTHAPLHVCLPVGHATTGDPDEPVGDVVVDLDQWTLRPAKHETGTEQFDALLPPIMQAALRTLSAPPLPTRAQFIDWVEDNAIASNSCGGKVDDPTWTRLTGRTKAVGAKKHTLHLDPHTFTVTSITGTKNSDPKAEHVLWGLAQKGIPCGCERVWQALSSFGKLDQFRRYSMLSQTQLDRLYAVRTLAHAVGYLDAGLDLTESAYLLEYGFHADHAHAITEAISQHTTTVEDVIAGTDDILHSIMGRLPAGRDDIDAITARILNPAHDADSDPLGKRHRNLMEVLSRVGQSIIQP